MVGIFLEQSEVFNYVQIHKKIHCFTSHNFSFMPFRLDVSSSWSLPLADLKVSPRKQPSHRINCSQIHISLAIHEQGCETKSNTLRWMVLSAELFQSLQKPTIQKLSLKFWFNVCGFSTFPHTLQNVNMNVNNVRRNVLNVLKHTTIRLWNSLKVNMSLLFKLVSTKSFVVYCRMSYCWISTGLL